ncbi:thioredoxin-related transmembrane protein 4 [Latimeria chalumnae]|uniref:thioredoxin-related transmembrane protein 4 n=1 Tax=Latimeria chalumnae TaxID=7897 RepID=UPI0003C1A85E|nr:PREDICTED: thioredoxin-related transmembrane protein 4 [Latimeria chalumnae]|eukprot:XP_005991148.1 PREDICTED: thioredoxin-related transmembrane protein 4 [Latimeria chalumnae]
MAGRSGLTAVVVSVLLALNGALGAGEQQVSALADSNWTLILQGEWLLKFYAPWCSACHQIQLEWERFANESGEFGIRVGKVDVTQQPGLSGRFFITTLPTIYHAKDGVFRRYLGSRTSEDLKSYIVQKKWEAVDPVPSWKSPSSIVMSGMSGLFHLSVWIRQIHNYLTETVGLPVWGSYAVFALSTLLMGLILGLILVLLVDCICPPKKRHILVKSEVNKKEDGEHSEEEQEDLSDDKKHHSDDAEDERSNMSDRASGEDSAGDEASGGEEMGQDETDDHAAKSDRETAVRQRKPQPSSSAEEKS